MITIAKARRGSCTRLNVKVHVAAVIVRALADSWNVPDLAGVRAERGLGRRIVSF
jgi:hypothetical protein